MPITVTPGPPLNAVGAGVPMLVQSDVVGPMPIGTDWVITFSVDAEGLQPIHKERVPWTGNPQLIYPHTEGTPVVLQQPYAIGNQNTVYTTVELQEPTGITDSGTSQQVWVAYEGQSEQIWRVGAQQRAQGGLTDQQAQQLATTEQNTTQQQQDWANYTSVTLPSLQDNLNAIWSGLQTTVTTAAGAVVKTVGELFSGKTFDRLTTFDLGTVCAPDVLDVDISLASFYGIQAACTAYADWYVFTGPGDTYTTQSLGTLEITRGGSVILRLGLHNTTHTVYPLPGVPLLSIETDLPVLPGAYHVKLWPAPETCWSVLALELP